MNKHIPIVIVKSEGDRSAETIITNIRKIPIDEDKINIDNTNLVGLKHCITTKYYKTQILFLPFDQPTLNTIPEELQNSIEALFIYFDAEKRESLDKIKQHMEYLKSNPIELVVLLCGKLCNDDGDEHSGISYSEIKKTTNLMDIVELDRIEEDGTEMIDKNMLHHDPVGYNELCQILDNFVWSNVEIKGATSSNNNPPWTSDDDDSDQQDDNDNIDRVIPSKNTASNIFEQNNDDPVNMEAELAGFESLLSGIMMFKTNVSSMSRNERLAYTQKLACAFEELIGDGDDEDDDDDNDFDDTNEIYLPPRLSSVEKTTLTPPVTVQSSSTATTSNNSKEIK